MPQCIAIIDYGMGNIHALYKKLYKLGVSVITTNDTKLIEKADKIILPGVGHFGNAMKNIESLGLLGTLQEAVMIKKKVVLGICLGMQLMANNSEEGNIQGLGWVNADVVKFRIKNKFRYKVPHIGWSEVVIKKNSMLMDCLEDRSSFYFVHSYHYQSKNITDVLNEANYEYSFVAAVEKENIFGVQYHPEKSHDNGIQVLKNFIKI